MYYVIHKKLYYLLINMNHYSYTYSYLLLFVFNIQFKILKVSFEI